MVESWMLNRLIRRNRKQVASSHTRVIIWILPIRDACLAGGRRLHPELLSYILMLAPFLRQSMCDAEP